MPDLDDYRCFATTVRHGSITAAAAELELSRPTLSRRLAALEEGLGLALLHRTTRRVTPTPAGQRLFADIEPLLDRLARIEAELRDERDDAQGLLRVSVPPVIAPDIAGLVVALRRRHPRLEVELLADIRFAELRSEGVEVAVRAGRVADPDLIQRRLVTADVSAVASPGYLERRGTPSRLEDLADHELLRGHAADGAPQRSWPLRDGGRIAVGGAFTTNDQRALLEAALADGGIALLSEVSSERALATGRLVRVLPDTLGATIALHAVYTRRDLQPARVRVFVDALVDWLGARGELGRPRGSRPSGT